MGPCFLFEFNISNLGNCKYINFRENFIFANNVKIHVCDVKNSRLEHDLPTPVSGRVISRFFLFSRNFD